MVYDFDTPVNRRNTACEKWDGMRAVFGREDLLPFWVADMDFRSAPEIVEALVKCASEGVFGYPQMTDAARQAVVDWESSRHDWKVKIEQVGFVPGVMTGLIAAIEEFTNPGDKIIVQPPIYPPFTKAVTHSGRTAVTNPLREGARRFEMDFDNLRSVITPDVRALLLSSPHNPVARVWSREELAALAKICVEHDIMILSDEIHQDLIYSDAKHIPIAAVLPDLAPKLVTFVAPSKTFNIAGLSAAAWIAQDQVVAARMSKVLTRFHVSEINLMAIRALEAAYTRGAAWLDEAMTYLQGNRDYVETFLREKLPRVKLKHPEGTFIFWLDFRDYGVKNGELQRILVKEAGVALNPGITFGVEGDGFARLNIGCPRSQLAEGLDRIYKTFVNR